MAKNPDEVRAFPAAERETVAVMRANQAATVRMAADVPKMPEPIAARGYDETFRRIAAGGRLDPTGLAVLRQSFVAMRMVPAAPDMAPPGIEKFLPGAALPEVCRTGQNREDET
ncbi:MAG TPA: hypothetical protein VNF99_02875 [Stellaceae bacterium]|nr:hypothetical protein [Stellaceae bacterium]